MKRKSHIIFFYLFFFSIVIYTQSPIFDTSISGVYSHVFRIDAEDGNPFHYELNPVFGYQFQIHSNWNLGEKELFQITGNLGFRNYGFEGRHFEKVLPNPPAKLFRQFFFSKYRLNSIFTSVGGRLQQERFNFFTNFQIGYILSVKEQLQEVHLSDVFNCNHFFPATQNSVTNDFNKINLGFELGLDYKIFKNIFLTIHYFAGIKSITNYDQLGYWYQSGIFSVGVKYANIIFKS